MKTKEIIGKRYGVKARYHLVDMEKLGISFIKWVPYKNRFIVNSAYEQEFIKLIRKEY